MNGVGDRAVGDEALDQGIGTHVSVGTSEVEGRRCIAAADYDRADPSPPRCYPLIAQCNTKGARRRPGEHQLSQLG